MSISFTTTHGALTSALALMRGLQGNRPTIPAFGLIRLAVTRTGATVESYDSETYVHVKLHVDDDDGLPGNLLVRRLQLADIVKALGDGSTKAKLHAEPVKIIEDGGTLRLASGGYTFTLPIVKDDEMLPTPPVLVDELVFVQREAMLTAVTRLLVCAGSDETLPMLTGIKVESKNGAITMAATDRFRLGVTGLKVAVMQDFQIDSLVPAKELSAACRFLPVGEEFQLGVTGDYVWLMSFGATVAIRPIDAEFVKYQSLIPQASDTSGHSDVTVPRKDLLSALRRSRAVTDRGHHARISFKGSKLQVTAGGEDEGRMESPDFGAERDDAAPLLIAFNPEYLAPALASFSTDSVAIRYSTPARPFLLAEPGHLDDETAFRTLVMPARLPG